jgi:hypothetical protein
MSDIVTVNTIKEIDYKSLAKGAIKKTLKTIRKNSQNSSVSNEIQLMDNIAEVDANELVRYVQSLGYEAELISYSPYEGEIQEPPFWSIEVTW